MREEACHATIAVGERVNPKQAMMGGSYPNNAWNLGIPSVSISRGEPFKQRGEIIGGRGHMVPAPHIYLA